jgi:hypothetical protein
MSPSRPRPIALPYSGAQVPHGVLEVNQACNLACRACYKHRSHSTKSVEEIQAELDFLLTRRRLSAVTLAGGEPSLHPELPRVIRDVRGRGLSVAMLSNGLALTDERLASYKAAGLSEVLLHVDCWQNRPDAPPGARCEADLHPLRRHLAERITRHGLVCSLAATVYRRTLTELPDLIRFVIETPTITRLLCTCCSDLQGAAVGFRGGPVLGSWHPGYEERTGRAPASARLDEGLASQAVELSEVEAVLSDQGMTPFGMIPSSLDMTRPRWLVLYAFTIERPDGGVSTLHISGRFQRLARLAFAINGTLRLPRKFARTYSARGCVTVLLLYALTAGHPSDAWAALRFLLGLLRPGAVIRHKGLAFQQGAGVTDTGELDYCLDCPDATVRNGRLVPVCMADYLDPLPAESLADPETEGERRAGAAAPPAAETTR